MKVLSIGGSGRVGQLMIDDALKRGHSVTALVRKSTSLSERSGLTVVEGDPRAKDDMENAFNVANADVVIVTLSSVRASDSPFAAPLSPPKLMFDCVENVLDCMKVHGTPKLVILQALGTGTSFSNTILPMKFMIRHTNMARSYEDHDAVDELVQSRDVNYVMARPTRLVEGDVKNVRTYGNCGKGISGFATISRNSVAHFLVDAADSQEWDKQTPVLSN